ncbi:MAG: hypothetical protein M4579_004678 [Chaenotheca gracillima]|nr:MAG: hypothetical protein M4579_004678 [Chaenotheca gracillima]
MESHKKAVATIAANVRQFYERKEPFRIFHGSTNSTRPSALQRNRMIDTSGLSHVLKVDTKARTALVEPNVPMDRLVDTTLKYGLVPPVVMEFPGITVGGGYAGTSGESSSFRHGFFNRTINYVEMVLANGDTVKASETVKPDLFHGAAGAVGSLGVTTLVELQLTEAKKYVETTYHRIASMPEAIRKLQVATADPTVDYVDGILYSKDHGAIITGRLTNSVQEGIKVQRFSRAWDPWFYLHVKDNVSESTEPVTEAIPLEDYLFRYDRGGFWVGASAFKYFMMPFNRITRWFLDDFLRTRMMYTALHASGHSKRYVVQDLALPYATATEFVEYTDRAFGIYPLWLCPLRQSALPTMHPHSAETETDGKTSIPLLNIGLWGDGPKDAHKFEILNRDLERKLTDLGGMKWLYAHTYYTEEEFWSLFDRKWYDALRAKYDATALPSVYDKVKVEISQTPRSMTWSQWLLNVWPISGLWGVWKSIRSEEYFKARKASWKSIEAKDTNDG